VKTKRNLIQIWLLCAVVLALPVAVQAQYTYPTNNGTITITGYWGLDGAGASQFLQGSKSGGT
jgi:hypothetical protein